MIICYHLLPALDPAKPRETKKSFSKTNSKCFASHQLLLVKLVRPVRTSSSLHIGRFSQQEVVLIQDQETSSPDLAKTYRPKWTGETSTNIINHGLLPGWRSWNFMPRTGSVESYWSWPGKTTRGDRVRWSPLVCFVEFKPPLMRC